MHGVFLLTLTFLPGAKSSVCTICIFHSSSETGEKRAISIEEHMDIEEVHRKIVNTILVNINIYFNWFNIKLEFILLHYFCNFIFSMHTSFIFIYTKKML